MVIYPVFVLLIGTEICAGIRGLGSGEIYAANLGGSTGCPVQAATEALESMGPTMTLAWICKHSMGPSGVADDKWEMLAKTFSGRGLGCTKSDFEKMCASPFLPKCPVEKAMDAMRTFGSPMTTLCFQHPSLSKPELGEGYASPNSELPNVYGFLESRGLLCSESDWASMCLAAHIYARFGK